MLSIFSIKRAIHEEALLYGKPKGRTKSIILIVPKKKTRKKTSLTDLHTLRWQVSRA